MKKKRSALVLSMIVILLSFFSSYRVMAQPSIQLVVDGEVDTSLFPEIGVTVSVFDAQGIPVKGLSDANFSYQEDALPLAKPQVVEIREHPVNIIIAVDVSRSMGFGPPPAPLESIVGAASDFVASLPNEDKVGVISIGEKPVLLQGLTGDKSLIPTALSWLKPESDSTAIHDSILKTISLLEGEASRRVIILLTDSVDSRSSATFDRVTKEAVDKSVVVFPIAWGGAKLDELKQLADLTRGQFIPLQDQYPDSGAIQSGFSQIQNALYDLRLQYRLSFTSGVPADDSTHSLKILVEHLGVSSDATKAFQAPPGQILVSFPEWTDSQEVGGLVKFAPQIDSPRDVASMEILMDDTRLELVTSPPWEYVWNSTSLPSGEEHKFTVIVKDPYNNQGQASIRLKVVQPVNIKITRPAGGSEVKGIAVVSVDTKAVSGIAKVEFFIDGKLEKTLDKPPFEIGLKTLLMSDGSHDIVVKATDINGFENEDRIKVIIKNTPSDGIPIALVIATAAGAGLLIILVVSARKRARIRRSKVGIVAEKERLPAEGAPILSAFPAVLLETDGMNPNHEWQLSGAREISLGRKRDENDIHLKGAMTSRKHAVIRFQDGEYVILNMKEENPVIINGNPVSVQQALRPGDIIQAGESIFQFQVKG